MMENRDMNYVVGRGRLFFAPYKPGTRELAHGELYLGNTPALSVTQDNTTLDHYSSESGLKEMDESVTIQSDMSGSFDTDDINLDNIALFFQGDRERNVHTGATDVEEGFTAMKGRHYQLGVDTAEGIPGVRNVSNLAITATEGATSVPLTDNIDVDLEKGRFYIEPDAPDIEDDTAITVTYDILPYSDSIVIDRSQQVRGQLRFVADNAVGNNRDYFWPDAKLTPNGDYSLKGDDWQVMSFNFMALRRGTAASRLMVTGNAELQDEPVDDGSGGST